MSELLPTIIGSHVRSGVMWEEAPVSKNHSLFCGWFNVMVLSRRGIVGPKKACLASGYSSLVQGAAQAAPCGAWIVW